MQEVDLCLKGNKKQPEAQMSWKSFKIKLDIRRIVDPIIHAFSLNKDGDCRSYAPVLTFEFDGLHVASPSIQFKDFLEPSSNKIVQADYGTSSLTNKNIDRETGLKKKSVLNTLSMQIARTLALHMDFKMFSFSFDFKMPAHQCQLQGSADKMFVSFKRSKNLQQEGFTVLNAIHGGMMEIVDEGQRAMLYAGHAARFAVDYQLATGHMDVMANLYGTEDDMEVYIRPFLSFYHKYQSAEDHAVEMKLARGQSVASKMSMGVEFEHMKIGVRDQRESNLLIVIVENVKASLISYRMTKDGRRTHKGKLCQDITNIHKLSSLGTGQTKNPQQKDDIPFLPQLVEGKIVFSPNFEKLMGGDVGKVTFQLAGSKHVRTVEGISMRKVLKVSNEGNFIDDDDMAITMENARFERVDVKMMDWLIIMQDTSNRLPSSRFSHEKNSTMTFHTPSFYFETQPPKFDLDIYSIPIPKDEESLPLPKVPLDENRWLSFQLVDFKVHKYLAAGFLDSQYSMDICKMEISTIMPNSDLEEQYYISMMSGVQDEDDAGSAGDKRTLFANTISNLEHGSDLLHSRSRGNTEGKLAQSSQNPQNGTIWMFDTFHVEFLLGLKMQFQQVKAKQLFIDFVNYSLPTHKRSSRNANSLIFSRHSFLSLIGVNVAWTGVKMSCDLGPMQVNASIAGAVKFLCAFSMLRKFADRVSNRMEAIKLTGNRRTAESAARSTVSPGAAPVPVDTEMNLLVADCTIVFSVLVNNEAKQESNIFTRPDINGSYPELPPCKFLVMKFKQLGHSTKERDKFVSYSFEHLEVFINSYTKKSFIDMRKVLYKKFKGNHPKDSRSKATISLSDVDIGSFEIRMHPEMEVGLLVDLLLMQESAFKVATTLIAQEEAPNPHLIYDLEEIGQSQDTIDTSDDESVLYFEIHDNLEESSKSSPGLPQRKLERGGLTESSMDMKYPETLVDENNNFSIVNVKIANYSVTLDGPFRGEYCEELLRVGMDELKIVIDASNSEDFVQDEIATLDMGEEGLADEERALDNFVTYQSIQGGQITCTMKRFLVSFATQNLPVLDSYNVNLTGPMYSASIKDDRVATEYRLVQLMDTILLEAEFQGDLAEDLNNQIMRGSGIDVDQMYVTVEKTTAPAKIYLDMTFKGEYMDVNLYPDTNPTLEAINAAMETCQPPNKDTSPALAFWDNMRYWVHGEFSWLFQRIQVNLNAQDYMFQSVKLSMILIVPELHLDRNSIQFAANETELSAELSMKMLAGRGKVRQRQKISQTTSRLCSIPSFVFALKHSYNLQNVTANTSPIASVNTKASPTLLPRIYSHHDVYLRPALILDNLFGDDEIVENRERPGEDCIKFLVNNDFADSLRFVENDRFLYFRSRPMAVRWDIEMRFADSPTAPVEVQVRLDNFVRIIDAFTQHGSEGAPPDIKIPSIILKTYGVKRQPINFSMTLLLNQIDLQLVVNKVVFSSWPSASNFNGVVFIQQLTDMQLRLLRKKTANVDITIDKSIIPQSRGVPFYPDPWKNNKSIPYASIDLNIKEQDFPLQIEHLFVDIYFADLYVREWNMPSPSVFMGFEETTKSSRVPFDFSNPSQKSADLIEPRCTDDILSLVKPLHKLAHASKVVVSLTESGEVSNRSNTFKSSGILEKREDGEATNNVQQNVASSINSKKAEFAIGKEWRRKTCGDPLNTRKSLQTIRKSLDKGFMSPGRKPLNKSEISAESFSPMGTSGRHRSNSLDASNVKESLVRKRRASLNKSPAFGDHFHNKWNPAVHGYRAALKSFSLNHSAFTPPSAALPNSYKGSRNGNIGMQNYRAHVGGTSEGSNSSFGGKIWGLRVVDVRILFTIQIRDIMFNYVGRCMDLFSQSNNDSAESPTVPAADNGASSSSSPSKEFVRRRPSSINLQGNKDKAVTLTDFLSVSEELVEKSPSTKVRKKVRNTAATLIPIEENNSSPEAAAISAATTPTLSPISPLRNALLRNVSVDTNEISSVTRHLLGEGTQDNSPEQNEVPMGIAAEYEEKTTTQADRHYQKGGRGIRRATAMRRGSLYNRSIELRDDANGAPKQSNAQEDSKPKTGKNNKKDADGPINQFFFLVELIDPQVNFLDVKSHSSLIIVAGRSSLEGRRLNTAVLPPTHSRDGKVLEPKRRREIRLRMDGVSAFTVPTLSGDNFDEEDCDEVHWKHMKSTTDAMILQQLPRDRISKNIADYGKILLTSKNEENTESRNLKVAIKDFQIRALYIFWTDVTAAEAKQLHIQPSREDLVCTFRLELPELEVDIYSWQFYAIVNVIRNVLLVPPPSATKHNRGSNDDNDDSANKVLELTRDADLLAKNDIKANLATQLDINNKLSRDELRVLIEESLNTALQLDVTNQGTARFVEVFIGKITWVLRTTGLTNNTAGQGNNNASNAIDKSISKASNQELIETALFGIYSTLNFSENRSITSLFEIQRFWAKNLNPGDDSTGFNDRTSVVIPVLSNGFADTCTRCGEPFDLQENHSKACTFHADDDGNPGEYKEITSYDELTGQETRYKAWTCCGRHHEFAFGCSARPHSCKEVMVSMRAETNPTTRIENVDVSVLKTLEVSIFPGASYEVRLQITRSLADVLHRYFSLQHDIENNANFPQLSSKGEDSTSEMVLTKGFSMDNEMKDIQPKKKKGILGFFKGRKPKKQEQIADSEDNHVSQPQVDVAERASSKSVAFHRESTSYKERSSISSVSGAPIEISGRPSMSRRPQSLRISTAKIEDIHTNSTATAVARKRQECLYIRYMRVGDINVDVSTAGFTINLENFKAVMEPFVKRREILDWQRLIWSLETHLVWSLTKNTASSSLTKLGEIFSLKSSNPGGIPNGMSMGGSLHNRGSITEVADTVENNLAKRSLLLGSPSKIPSHSKESTNIIKWKTSKLFGRGGGNQSDTDLGEGEDESRSKSSRSESSGRARSVSGSSNTPSQSSLQRAQLLGFPASTPVNSSTTSSRSSSADHYNASLMSNGASAGLSTNLFPAESPTSNSTTGRSESRKRSTFFGIFSQNK